MTTGISMEARVSQSSRIAARVVDGKAVVVIIDTQALHTLNEVGTFVWELLEESSRSVSELVDSVEASFEVERTRAQADLLSFLGQMSELGALEVEEAA